MNKVSLDTDKMEHPWKTLTDALDIGVLLAGDDWELEFANKEALALLGCRDACALADLWKSTLKARFAASSESAGEEPRAASFELQIAGEERPRRLHWESYPVEEEPRLKLLLLRDRDRAEPDPGDLRLMGRYRSLARLYRTMGHDLKAPLNALTINLDLLKTSLSRYAPPDPMIRERQQRYLKVLEDELNRLNRSLLAFLAQAVPPTQEAMHPFCLREMLMELISLIAPQGRQQQVAIELRLDEQEMTLEGQRDLLKQAILNLAVNALEAMTAGGRLTIRLETRMGHAIIQLQDTGPGIAPEDLGRIWELNYTTKKSGSGIGLYVSRSVIESFGGSVTVESRRGQGTCFTITLPIISGTGGSPV